MLLGVSESIFSCVCLKFLGIGFFLFWEIVYVDKFFVFYGCLRVFRIKWYKEYEFWSMVNNFCFFEFEVWFCGFMGVYLMWLGCEKIFENLVCDKFFLEGLKCCMVGDDLI